MKKILYFGIGISLCLILSTTRGVAQNDSPFGACMHLQGGSEHVKMPENLRLAREAGIRWVRADFSWGGVEGPQGVWHFDHLDRVVEDADKMGIQLLPLLLYEVPWARPAYKHLDAWLTYVEKVVTRYKDKIRCWEVWNEPNLYPRFWDKRDDGENYALLLKATYRKIKEIDPELVVVHGGTCGIPLEYIEKSLAAGSAQAFDKMAVHPYRPRPDSWETILDFKDAIDQLRAIMTKYKIGHKGIWFTEMGISSMAGVAVRDKDVFHEIKAETGKDWKVAVVCDDEFPVNQTFTAQTLRSLFPSGCILDTIQIFDMRRIPIQKYDAVFFPPSENIPLHVSQILTPYLTKYMRAGGKVYYYSVNGNMYCYSDAAEREINQALFVAQTLCLSLRFGVEKYFYYEMESPENNFFDREDNFGLTRHNLSPKPAYYAHATLGKLFPEGSKIDTSVAWRQKDCCVIGWKQPDGTRVWAVWSPEGDRKVNVKIGKGLKQTLHYLGHELPDIKESSETVEICAETIYLVGAETFEIK